MPIQPGTRLGPYEVVAPLGAGGMGEVYRAKDTQLKRDVALKVLPAALATDADRLARFQREAELLAALNHPNIAHIYGFEYSQPPGAEDPALHSDGASGLQPRGISAIVMELVEGPTLAERIARGPIPVGDVLPIAQQLAQALEYAHERGIVHRDLKPANIKVTPDGHVKVLDFGLAKALAPDLPTSADGLDAANSPTITTPALTEAGIILGTAAYMSPEQASGQPADRRCDIWSFGVVLFEMLTGRRLFGSETISHTLADVLRAPIDVTDLPADVPKSIRRLIERCLVRDRMRRLRDIGEARIAIEDAMSSPGAGAEVADAPRAAGPSSKPSLLPWIVAGLAVVAAAAAFLLRPEEERPRRFVVEVPNAGRARAGDGRSVAISSDGRSIVTRGGAGAEDMLYMRDINRFEPQPIDGTVHGANPVFSPNDQWIAFLGVKGLRKVRVTGGQSEFLAESDADGLDWGEDERIYFPRQGTIWRVSDEASEPELVVEADSDGRRRFAFPFLMPGAETLLCSTLQEAGRSGALVAVDLATKSVKDLDMAGSNPRYLDTGHVLFAQSDRVFVAPFDRDTLEFTGPPRQVHLRAWVDQGQIQMDIASDGTVVYLPMDRGNTQQLVSVGLDGTSEPLLTEALPFTSFNDPRVSHDGRRVLIVTEGEAIWMIDLDTKTPTLMTDSGFYPLWSPDDSEILFGRSPPFDIYRLPVDLSRPEAIVLNLENDLRTADWTRRGQVVIREHIPGKGMDLRLWTDPRDPTSVLNLLDGPEDELAPVVSRDNEWMAYVSSSASGDEIFVTSFPTPGQKTKISVSGGSSPSWAPDGSAVYYFEGNKMIAASVETGPSFRVTDRRTLFEGEYVQYSWSRQYDIFPDIFPGGTRFLLITNPPRGNVEVVTRWFEELLAGKD